MMEKATIVEPGSQDRSLGNALRKGGADRPQIRVHLVDPSYHGNEGSYDEPVGVCALGAIYVGLSGELPSDSENESYDKIEYLVQQEIGIDLMIEVVNPANTHEVSTLEYVIMQLSDFYHWPFEQIADWLDTNPWKQIKLDEESYE